mmetsp:Transcript_79513/g.165110  ORF Transcript_79513/g.165110 Transcript_79513/m.165110 type:complete len:219 (+) Transcript_79513:616-1272(+)
MLSLSKDQRKNIGKTIPKPGMDLGTILGNWDPGISLQVRSRRSRQGFDLEPQGSSHNLLETRATHLQPAGSEVASAAAGQGVQHFQGLAQSGAAGVALHGVLGKFGPELGEEGEHRERGPAVGVLGVAVGPDTWRQSEAVRSSGVVVEAPIDALGVHLLLPELNRLWRDMVVDVTVFDQDLALRVVVVWRHIHLALVFLLSHPSHFGSCSKQVCPPRQ